MWLLCASEDSLGGVRDDEEGAKFLRLLYMSWLFGGKGKASLKESWGRRGEIKCQKKKKRKRR